jgi:flagellar motor component MotA
MDDGTIFYVIGPLLAVSAVVVSFIGLRSEKFPGRAAPLVFLWFAILVGGATTFAVLHSKDEETHKEKTSGLPQATREAEEEESR